MCSPVKECMKLNVADVQKGIKQYLQNDIFQDYINVHKKYIQTSSINAWELLVFQLPKEFLSVVDK